MAEPRARLHRNKGAVFPTQDLSDLLYAYGDATRQRSRYNDKPTGPLPSTIACLDEILTDFIIETCHYAALSASYSRRQKIKVDDFKFVLRRDEQLLGRVLEQLWREKRIKEQRSMMDINKFGAEGGGGVGVLEGLAAAGGVGAGEMKEKKKGREKGKRKKKDGEDDGRSSKRVAS